MRLETAITIAETVKKLLSPHCDRIEIAGSIRRRKPHVNDIDMVLVPKPHAALTINAVLCSLGILKLDGHDIKRIHLAEHHIDLDLYLATPATWATLLLIRTGSKDNNITLCTLARRRGWHPDVQLQWLHLYETLAKPQPPALPP